MYVCLLNKPIELYHSTTYFAIFYISLQILNNVMDTPDRVHVTKSIVHTTSVTTQIHTTMSSHVLN